MSAPSGPPASEERHDVNTRKQVNGDSHTNGNVNNAQVGNAAAMPPPTAATRRRVKFSEQDINAQLAQLHLFSSLSSNVAGDIEQLGSIIVNIHKSRQQNDYLKALRVFVHEKEQEIEDMCTHSYQDFVGSVAALLRVRQGTISLRHRVMELNEDVQKSGAGVFQRKKSLLDARRVGQNIDDVIDTLQSCLRVLDAANNVERLADAGKHFAALRVRPTTEFSMPIGGIGQLEDLQATHLSTVVHYPFATLMAASVTVSRNAIREVVTKALKTWMFDAREASRAVGKSALEAMDARNRRWNAKRRKESTLILAKMNGPVELGVSERHEYNPLDNDSVSMSFQPLYRCIHIYESLDVIEDLQLSYQSDRRAQAQLLLSQSMDMGVFSVESLNSLLEEIVGFFLIESQVLKTTSGFRSEQDVEDLWNGMCERIVTVVDKGLADCEDPEVFLGTKLKIMTFVQTLEGYGYAVHQLHALLLTLFERYSQLLQRKFSGDFEQIVLDDDHQSMVVNDVDEFDKVISISWLPKTEQYYQFSEGYAEHHRDIDDVLRKALDNLLIKQVSENIQRRLQMINNLSQLSQIVVNVLFFQTACSELESLLVSLRATQRGGTIHLESLASFQHTLTLTQERIVANISQKMDSFFEEAEYDWTSLQAPGSPEASAFLQDLIDFLSTVMMSVLIQLPEFAKDFVYRGALSHCASLLFSYLIDTEPAAISDGGLQQVHRDVLWLIEHVKTLQNDKLLDVFAELQQTLHLLVVAPSVLDYLDPASRQRLYNRLQPRRLTAVLSKLQAHYVRSTGAPGLTATRRRTAVDELLRSLGR
ncbi:Rab GTPase-binding exocyst subunit S15 [Microbotryomycetes sp. JL221]|nr:Rab GTPase-binding exocyst subunit S15 [Microbotryomycetes sp. JL221]